MDQSIEGHHRDRDIMLRRCAAESAPFPICELPVPGLRRFHPLPRPIYKMGCTIYDSFLSVMVFSTPTEPKRVSGYFASDP